jgi:probable rRNA maturation factor
MILPLEIDLVQQAGDWPDHVALQHLIENAVHATLETASLSCPAGAELSVVLSDDAHVQALNRQWRDIDTPTNVLSFPSAAIEPGGMPEMLLGDIVFAHETIVREAMAMGKTFNDHFTHLIVHGFLHIFGYDHQNDKDAKMMENLERRSLAALGLPDPYEMVL